MPLFNVYGWGSMICFGKKLLKVIQFFVKKNLINFFSKSSKNYIFGGGCCHIHVYWLHIYELFEKQSLVKSKSTQECSPLYIVPSRNWQKNIGGDA
jgi:hypothetical protein